IFETLRRQIAIGKLAVREPEGLYTRLTLPPEHAAALKRECCYTEAPEMPSFAGVKVVVDPACVRPYFETVSGQRVYLS
ncbi:hypothetical protein, partial [Bacillus subtilis]|uniref:hypothetical protein n=1 Tax=Bacillus subtilis TaxID=1423 RepID=UPI003C15D817